MLVKVKLREFTYKDSKGYHTVVGRGEVPPSHPDVQKALKKGYLIELKSDKSDKPKDKQEKK